MGQDLQDSRDFGRGFSRIRKTLGEDLQGYCETLGEDLQDFAMTLGEDSQVFVRIWERICKDSVQDLGDFGRGFAMICGSLREESRDFG